MFKSGMFKKVFSRKMLVVFVLGFASGLPFVLTSSVLKQWLAQEKVDIKTIGFFSLVGIAYSFKYLWAPLLDRYFFEKLGRRKTWIMASQLGLVIGMIQMGSWSSATTSLAVLAGFAVFVAFMSATQDIAIDALRREYLTDEEIGLGSSMNVYGYRVAMVVAGGIFVSLVGDNASVDVNKLTWNQLYYCMAAIMAACFVVTYFINEGKSEAVPRTIVEAVINPFIDFLKRPEAFLIIAFVFTFKLGDQISGSLLAPFYKDMGYTNAEIGLIAKTYGLFSTLAGLLVGGIALLKFSVQKCLYFFGILQGLSSAAFALITFTGPDVWALTFTVIFEDFSQGMGTAAFTAYMAMITNKKYTATQFALLTSFAALGRTLFSGAGGVLQASVGWANFFYLGGLLAIPGLLLLWWMSRKGLIAQTTVTGS